MIPSMHPLPTRTLARLFVERAGLIVGERPTRVEAESALKRSIDRYCQAENIHPKHWGVACAIDDARQWVKQVTWAGETEPPIQTAPTA